jgi:hypothetical protein
MYEVKRQGRNGFAVKLADGSIEVEIIEIDKPNTS